MTSKNVENYLKSFQEIKDLDDKIEKLAKIAQVGANNNIDCYLDITVKDLDRKDNITEKESADKIVEFNEYVARIFGNNISADTSYVPKPIIHHSYNHKLSNNTLLKLLAVILQDLRERRDILTSELSKKV